MIKLTITFIIVRSMICSFEYRENRPSALFPYNYAVDEINSGNTSTSAYLPLLDYSFISSSYGRPYSALDINSSNVSIGTGTGSLGAQTAWSRFGIDEYREDIIKGNAGIRPVKYISTGAGISYYHLYINTDELKIKKSIYDFSFSTALFPFRWIDICFQQENVISLFNKERQDLIYPGWSTGLSLKPSPGISLTWNINKTYYGYINSFSISANLLRYLNIKAGYSRETATYAASINIIIRSLNISYGLRHHPYLGITHCFGTTLSTKNLSFEQINYNRRLLRRNFPDAARKININSCSLEELKKIPVLEKGHPERIVKYRKVIGPVSKKSLLQIGMTSKDINALKKYIHGLAPDSVKKKKNKKWRKAHRRRISRKRINYKKRKLLFKRLLISGISSVTAFKISKMAGKAGMKSLTKEIENIAGITPEHKKLIIKICKDTL